MVPPGSLTSSHPPPTPPTPPTLLKYSFPPHVLLNYSPLIFCSYPLHFGFTIQVYCSIHALCLYPPPLAYKTRTVRQYPPFTTQFLKILTTHTMFILALPSVYLSPHCAQTIIPTRLTSLPSPLTVHAYNLTTDATPSPLSLNKHTIHSTRTFVKHSFFFLAYLHTTSLN